MKNTFLVFMLLVFSTKIIASDDMQVFVKGGNKKIGTVETSVIAKKVPNSGNCTSENSAIKAKFTKDFDFGKVISFNCGGSKPYMETGSFNETFEPFGEAFAYATEIINKYKKYHKKPLFDSQIELSFVGTPHQQANAGWSENSKTIKIYSGNTSDDLYAPTAKTAIYHELGHAVSKMNPTKPSTDNIAIDEAFADIFAVFFNNIDTIETQNMDWTIGYGYSRKLSAIRYVNTPRLDNSVENLNDIKPNMNAYQRGGFIRKMFFNMYTKLTDSGFSKKKSLEYSYLLFYKANERFWQEGMTFEDLAISIYEVYINDYRNTFSQSILVDVMNSVGLNPTVKYTLNNKAGFVARIKVTYFDAKGNQQTIYGSSIPVAKWHSVTIPAIFSPSATIFVQYDSISKYIEIGSFFPDQFQSACVNTWGTIFSPQAKIGNISCNF